jgi:uncharacterized protein YbbC (DUF1343 family)
MPVQTGIEVLRGRDYADLRGLRVGLMTNPSAIDRALISTYRLLTAAPGLHLTALFAPEHGFAAALPDAEHVSHQTDPRTRLPVYSLYGESYRPTPEMLRAVDVLVCDIQDIGVRFYTFVWTVTHILEAAGAAGVRVLILDRPNPLGGVRVMGPLLDPTLTSFVGRVPLPVTHGLTLGELARMFNARWNPTPAELAVIPCAGWQRAQTWEQTGLPWVPPSPNMPRLSTLAQYPGACLIEGTTLSEGRGTALPFEIVGAPWIDAQTLADALNAAGWGGVRFRPHTFQPTASKWAGQVCGGVQVYITDPAQWQPIETWLGVIQTIRALYPDHFSWLLPGAAGVEQGTVWHFDRLIGAAAYRQRIDQGAALDDLIAGWEADTRAFRAESQAYWLYPEQ